MAITAGSASATTLEVAGVAQTTSIIIAASSETSITLSDTEGAQANTCSVSNIATVTSVFSGFKVTGSVAEFSFTTCTRSPVTVASRGGLRIEWESGTTSGIVYSENAVVQFPTTFGFSVTCTTAQL